jgi:hypothetical protein
MGLLFSATLRRRFIVTDYSFGIRISGEGLSLHLLLVLIDCGGTQSFLRGFVYFFETCVHFNVLRDR